MLTFRRKTKLLMMTGLDASTPHHHAFRCSFHYTACRRSAHLWKHFLRPVCLAPPADQEVIDGACSAAQSVSPSSALKPLTTHDPRKHHRPCVPVLVACATVRTNTRSANGRPRATGIDPNAMPNPQAASRRSRAVASTGRSGRRGGSSFLVRKLLSQRRGRHSGPSERCAKPQRRPATQRTLCDESALGYSGGPLGELRDRQVRTPSQALAASRT